MALDTTHTYASFDDLKNRLTSNGYLNLADRDSDGVVDPEGDAILQEAIEQANQVIDGYLQTRIDPDDARGQGNVWLRDRCVDLACYNACALGGRDIPETFVVIRDDAIQMLREVSRGTMHVPRMTYPYQPAAGTRTQRVPRSFNFGKRG